MRAADDRGAPPAIENSLWVVNHTPLANVQATITKAAPGPGKRLVITSIVASMASNLATSVAATKAVQLLDGLTAVKTVYMSVPPGIGAAQTLALRTIVPISSNSAATLQFGSAGGLGIFQSVTLSGYVSEG